MHIDTPALLVGPPIVHGEKQWADVEQPINKVPEYQPIIKREEGVEAYQQNWETLSKRLWIC